MSSNSLIFKANQNQKKQKIINCRKTFGQKNLRSTTINHTVKVLQTTSSRQMLRKRKIRLMPALYELMVAAAGPASATSAPVLLLY